MQFQVRISQEFRQPVRASAPPRKNQKITDDTEEDIRRHNKNRKTPVEIIRKYRTDNEDGSITWGFENEDGTFKEENIGVDCITRGKYGYFDPDGVRREFNYETGAKCDPEEEELLEEEPVRPPPSKNIAPRKPQQTVVYRQ